VAAGAPVLVDHREAGSGIADRLRAAGVAVEEADLPVGDYVVSDALVVERKSEWDLTASIKDGRLFEQAERLQEAFPRAVLIVEGEPAGMAEAGWRGAVCKLLEDGVTVLHALDAEDSAAWIERLAKRARRTGRSPRALGRRRAAPTPHAQARAMLACVPGISWAMAGVLLDELGSVAAIAASDVRRLREVPGIGTVRARRLLDALGPVAHAGDPPAVPREPRTGAPDDRRWLLLPADEADEPRRFARRAIALRALGRHPSGASLLDTTTGEVVAEAPAA
jgi:DNA excision repair protein ERCC-4